MVIYANLTLLASVDFISLGDIFKVYSDNIQISKDCFRISFHLPIFRLDCSLRGVIGFQQDCSLNFLNSRIKWFWNLLQSGAHWMVWFCAQISSCLSFNRTVLSYQPLYWLLPSLCSKGEFHAHLICFDLWNFCILSFAIGKKYIKIQQPMDSTIAAGFSL